MTQDEFIAKGQASELKERSEAQEHSIDLYRLLGEPTPAEADPKRDHYCFDRGADKDSGGAARADVWQRHCFAWEYKGSTPTSMLCSTSLKQYALGLETPPLCLPYPRARTPGVHTW